MFDRYFSAVVAVVFSEQLKHGNFEKEVSMQTNGSIAIVKRRGRSWHALNLMLNHGLGLHLFDLHF